MIDHVSIRVRDLKKSAAFYEATLGAIGYKRLIGDFGETAAFAIEHDEVGKGSVWISEYSHKKGLTQNMHVAFAVPDIESVKRFYDAAMAAGGRDNGAPGLCPEYGSEYYGGFVFDPDGNNVEAVTKLRKI